MLELQRNVIFGQYIETGSPIHRLDPRIKLLAAGVLIVASFLIGGYLGFALLLPLLALVQVVSRLPLGFLLRGSRLFLIFLAVILALEILLSPTPTQVLWRWHFVSISLGAAKIAGILALRVIVLYYVTTVLLLVTPLVDLTDALELLLRPLQRLRLPVQELIMVWIIALKFVPIFTNEAERLATARAARGAPIDAGGPLKRARGLGRLLVPIFISGFRRADVLTMAMDARCYRGGAGRTKWRHLEAAPSEWLVLVGVIAWTAICWIGPQLAGF